MFGYTLLKIVHLLSVVFFMGSIFFMTYVLDYVKKENLDFVKKISKRARALMFINIPFLIVSGGCLLFFFHDISNLNFMMIVKISISLFIILVFYTSRKIIEKTNHIAWFHHFFHHAVVGMMVVVVIVSQVMF